MMPCKVSSGHIRKVSLILLTGLLISSRCLAQRPPSTPEDLKKLSLEELMDIEVTSVSKRAEKLADVASAVQVITADEIRRSGATSLPEALRLASNLQVAQLNSSAWIISARGFNAVFANKLLVMIDGRTVYSPLFAGVFWDAQQVLLEDVERIEVISGPGGAVWGANAVNGVINIITRNASDTQGLYASAGAGSLLRRNAALRYGGKLGPQVSWRVYGMHADRDHTFLNDGSENDDAWNVSQGGFSVNWTASDKDEVVAHGNVYTGMHETMPAQSDIDGQNILARWSHTREASRLVVQTYYDRTWRRDIPSTISDQTLTYDLDVDHSFKIGRHHSLVWGGGYRYIDSETINRTEFVGLIPQRRGMDLFSAFIQSELALVEEKLKVIVGTKLQHNVFTGFEIQPTGRMAWTGSGFTVWGAVSRAVRTPSRIDVDYFLPTYPVSPNVPNVAGGPDFVSEKVIAYELGYRVHPSSVTFLSLAAFNNKYDDLYSVEALPNTLTYQIQNGTEGTSRGVELTGRTEIMEGWRLQGGYTYFYKDLANKPGRVYDYTALGNDAENRISLLSMLDLPGNLQLDVAFRYLDPLPNPKIHDYLTFDARIAWLHKAWEISLSGKNLWEDRHREFLTYLPRHIYANIACRL